MNREPGKRDWMPAIVICLWAILTVFFIGGYWAIQNGGPLW
jgi:nitrate reductase NapE component